VRSILGDREGRLELVEERVGVEEEEELNCGKGIYKTKEQSRGERDVMKKKK
jgi:hypothetical protein